MKWKKKREITKNSFPTNKFLKFFQNCSFTSMQWQHCFQLHIFFAFCNIHFILLHAFIVIQICFWWDSFLFLFRFCLYFHILLLLMLSTFMRFNFSARISCDFLRMYLKYFCFKTSKNKNILTKFRSAKDASDIEHSEMHCQLHKCGKKEKMTRKVDKRTIK